MTGFVPSVSRDHTKSLLSSASPLIINTILNVPVGAKSLRSGKRSPSLESCTHRGPPAPRWGPPGRKDPTYPRGLSGAGGLLRALRGPGHLLPSPLEGAARPGWEPAGSGPTPPAPGCTPLGGSEGYGRGPGSSRPRRRSPGAKGPVLGGDTRHSSAYPLCGGPTPAAGVQRRCRGIE